MIKFFFFVILLLQISCTKSERTAKDTLIEFVNFRFSNSQSIDRLRPYLAEDLFKKISELPANEIDKFFGINKRKLMKLKINSENCTDDTCLLTYLIQYEDKLESKDRVQVYTKKTAQMRRIDSSWLIIDVDEIKTFLDFKNPI
ncbi:MAG: hypothetical protein A2X86_04755 [Bdellovibrionales bacterium GWA2_49_15]|nr:MAG: hypothetical protein A2X86_04755 [Bdellovibrionales bacterium GWA2_49_15]